MICSSEIALLSELRYFELPNEIDLHWTSTRPKKPRYQRKFISLAVVRKVPRRVEDGGPCTPS